ncbi:MAG: hypothetical protein ACTSRP_13550 [Candidatus Helarchaeota archaeon]
MEGYSDSIKILLTTRILDWKYNRYITSVRSRLRDYIYPNNSFDNIKSEYQLGTPISWFLSGFSDEQLDAAISKYNLDKARFSPKLYELSKRPYVLRLIYQRNEYPDPDNIEEFMPFVYNPKYQENTIFERMNIIGEVLDFLTDLLKIFRKPDAIKSRNELSSLINQKQYSWYVILLSGLIIEKHEGLRKYYMFDPIFQPIIRKFMEILFPPKESELDDSIKKPDIQPHQTSTPDSESSDFNKIRKRTQYLINQGEYNLQNNNLDYALEKFNEAKKYASEQLLDFDLEIRIDKLIQKVKSIKKYQENLNRIETALNSEDIKNLDQIIRESQELATQYELNTTSLSNLIKQYQNLINQKHQTALDLKNKTTKFIELNNFDDALNNLNSFK